MMRTSFPLSLTAAAASLRAGTLSSVDLLQECFRYADELNGSLHAYISCFGESANLAAEQADRDFAAGIDRGPLQGIPISVKDNIPTIEAPARGGSRIDNPAWDECRDAPVIVRLREAGAVISGKALTMELAVGVPDLEQPGTEARNPWNAELWSGGSSSGGGSGLPARMFLASLGSDTGGSIRVPAAYCGVTGLTPTFGRVPKTDVIPLGPSLDVVGPLTRTAEDAAHVLQVLAGYDPADPYSADRAVPDYAAALGAPIEGLRVGVVKNTQPGHTLASPELEPCLESAAAVLESQGALLREIELPLYAEAFDAVVMTFLVEGQAQHATELREQWERFAPPTRQSLAGALFYTAGDYVMAQKVRRTVRLLVTEVFDDVDIIVMPTNLTGALALDGFDLTEYVQSVCTQYWNAVGNPVVSIPMGFTAAGLPLGMQIAGRHFDEATVLQVADAYQRRTDWHLRVPPLVAACADAGED